MRWRTGRRSRNVEDRRGSQSFPGRGRSPFPASFPKVGRRGLKRGGGLSGGAIVIIIIIGLITGQNPLQMLGMLTGGGGGMSMQGAESQGVPLDPSANDEDADFVSAVLADTEDTWQTLFSQAGARYQAPTLVLYNDLTRTACGTGQAASGPFYCPADSKVYLDLGFFNELKRLGAPGDFAVAYVIAHEIGHHVQNLSGTSDKVFKQRQRSSKKQGNALSVLQELQADCYAGVWAHHAQRERNILEAGDIEEGLDAAASVGDDRLQRQAGRAVQPEAFTHGSSKQRMRWFRVGFEYGDVAKCNTFK